MSKNEIEKSLGSAPAIAGQEVSGLSSGILTAAEDLESNKLRLQQAQQQPSFFSDEDEDPGFLESIFYLALSPVLLPLGLGLLAYEKIWRPIANHVKTSKQLKLESEQRLAALVDKRPAIVSGGKIHENVRKLNYRNSHAADFRNMELEDGDDAEQRRKAMLDEAQTLVDRATRSLHGKASPKSLGDQEEAP